MDLSTLDGAYIAMVFLVPGYVYFAIRGHLVAGHRARGTEALIRLLSVSCVNFALTGWYVYYILGDPSSSALDRAIAWTVTILVAPATLGLLSGAATQAGVMKWIYGKLRLKSVHVVPTSWDYAFSGRASCYVIITLQNGDRFAGIWGDRSFASDVPEERDVYLEKVFEIGTGEDAWRPTGKSVLIKAQEIRFIEFIQSTGSENVK